MNGKRVIVIEICMGLLLIVVGFILLLWSRQLLWILIYPPPWEKQFIDSLPYIFWGIGAFFMINGVIRLMKREEQELE